jgi:putative membrane protein
LIEFQLIFYEGIGLSLNAPQTEGRGRADIPESDPRVQMAAERTLLAWIRTGLALMAFGFVVSRFAFVLQTLGLTSSVYFSVQAAVIGVLMMILGVVSTAGAPWHYRGYFRRIGSQGAKPFAAWSLVMLVAYSTAFVGALLAVYLVLVDLVLVDLASWGIPSVSSGIDPID